MSCEIQSRNDFLTGAYLVTSVPENEVDQNALHTIQADCPDFILPFHYKRTDGEVEFIFKVGVLSKLQYFSGEFNTREYTDLWQSILNPLLDCGDWFMSPCSFVLNTEYLYYDKNKKSVSYVYIPSSKGCSGYDAFHEMATGLSKLMTASDAVLENKVLRSIIEDFSPTQFLKMLQDHLSETVDNQGSPGAALYYENQCGYVVQTESGGNFSDMEVPEPFIQKQDNGDDMPGDINPDIILEQSKRDKENNGYKMFSGKSKKKRTVRDKVPQRAASQAGLMPNKATLLRDSLSPDDAFNAEIAALQPELKPDFGHISIPDAGTQAENMDITQNTSVLSGGTGLRYIGRAHLPQSIQIPIAEGEMFTIGRFDVSVGKQQSSFEFDKKTKAVSRRHAVIERDISGYRIVDLSSSAGTFVNDKKLPPNMPHGLESGYRVSFGNYGADYVWEIS